MLPTRRRAPRCRQHLHVGQDGDRAWPSGEEANWYYAPRVSSWRAPCSGSPACSHYLTSIARSTDSALWRSFHAHGPSWRCMSPWRRRGQTAAGARRTWLARRAAFAACLRSAASKEVAHDAWYSSSIAWLVAERASAATSEEEPRLPRLQRSSRRPDDGYGFGCRAHFVVCRDDVKSARCSHPDRDGARACHPRCPGTVAGGVWVGS